MKIMGYEVWDFEEPFFQKALDDSRKEECGTYFDKRYLKEKGLPEEIEINWVKEPINKGNVVLSNGVDGISINSRSIIDEEILLSLKEYGVTFISTRSIGLNHIDLNKAKELGIKVKNSPYSPHAVSDFTIMSILEALRFSKLSKKNIPLGDFSLNPLLGGNLASQTVGLIGCGDIGSMCAKKLHPFECKVLVNTKSGNIDAIKNEYWAKNIHSVELDYLLKESDVISLHTPLTSETKNLLDSKAFSKMKDGVIIINTARGEIIDQASLIESLNNGKVSFAALDVFHRESGKLGAVFDPENIDDKELYELMNHENVVLTPHIAFLTTQAQEETVIRSIMNLIGGEYI